MVANDSFASAPLRARDEDIKIVDLAQHRQIAS